MRRKEASLDREGVGVDRDYAALRELVPKTMELRVPSSIPSIDKANADLAAVMERAAADRVTDRIDRVRQLMTSITADLIPMTRFRADVGRAANHIVEVALDQIDSLIEGAPETEDLESKPSSHLLIGAFDFLTMAALSGVTTDELYERVSRQIDKVMEQFHTDPDALRGRRFIVYKMEKDQYPAEFPAKNVPGWVMVRDKMLELAELISTLEN
jgi:hypothetical protein